MPETFDVVVLGAGPAGEHAVNALLSENLSVALVEGELIGGECSNWACIPTKTLLRPPEVQRESERVAGVSRPGFDWPRIREYRDYMVSSRDDAGRISSYQERGVTVVKAAGRLSGPGRVEAGDRLLEAPRILVSTGSTPVVPPINGLAEAGYWTNREATSFDELPESVIIVGGGAVGVELAQMMARFGTRTSLVHSRDVVMNREDRRVGELLGDHLRADGVELHLGRRGKSVRHAGAERVLTLDSGEELRGQELIVATGRTPRTADLGLETVGIEAGERGIAVDEHCRAGEGVWAAGDVTGVMLFTHNGKYQARIAVADMLGRPRRADYRAIPRVVFTHPEVGAVGLSERDARERGVDVMTAVVDLPEAIARPYTYEQNPAGTLGVVADRERNVLVGAWAVAPQASEWIHQAGLAIRAEVPLEVLQDTVAQFPTYSEGYLSSLQALSP